MTKASLYLCFTLSRSRGGVADFDALRLLGSCNWLASLCWNLVVLVYSLQATLWLEHDGVFLPLTLALLLTDANPHSCAPPQPHKPLAAISDYGHGLLMPSLNYGLRLTAHALHGLSVGWH